MNDKFLIFHMITHSRIRPCPEYTCPDWSSKKKVIFSLFGFCFSSDMITFKCVFPELTVKLIRLVNSFPSLLIVHLNYEYDMKGWMFGTKLRFILSQIKFFFLNSSLFQCQTFNISLSMMWVCLVLKVKNGLHWSFFQSVKNGKKYGFESFI